MLKKYDQYQIVWEISAQVCEMSKWTSFNIKCMNGDMYTLRIFVGMYAEKPHENLN